MYGRRSDALNANTPTDRLIAEWSTGPETRPRPPIETKGLPRLIEVRERPEATMEKSPDGPAVLLEIPPDIALLRRDDPELAEAWSVAVRRAFTAAFAAGYRAEGFLREESNGSTRCFYRLVSPDKAHRTGHIE